MRIFLKIIAWFGVAFVLLAVIFFWSVMTTPYSGGGPIFYEPITLILASIGIGLAIIGGLLGRPRYFWLAIIIIGLIFSASVIPDFTRNLRLNWELRPETALQNMWLFIVWPSLPAIIGLAEGIVLRVWEKKRNKKIEAE